MRVLYIDDDRVNALLFVEACRLAPDLDVQTAGSGEEAHQMVAEWPPDLLVIDLHLPDTDGITLLGALRDRRQHPTLPAFLCTADETHRGGEAARAAGFAGCWCKPVDLPMVLADLAAHALLVNAAQAAAPTLIQQP
jgi:CheY-like chemotaxis protein